MKHSIRSSLVLLVSLTISLFSARTPALAQADAPAPPEPVVAVPTPASIRVSVIPAAPPVVPPAFVWWEVEKEVVSSLLQQNLIELAKAAARQQPPTDPKNVVRQLDIFVRAGHRQDASRMVSALAAHRDRISPSEINSPLTWLIDRQEDELARQLIEQLGMGSPHNIRDMLDRWNKSGDPKAPVATDILRPQIDEWLTARAAAGDNEFWTKQRLRLHVKMGDSQMILAEQEQKVRANPGDYAAALSYITLLSEGGSEVSADWMGDVCQPALAVENLALGARLVSRSPKAARTLLERSLAMPITQADLRHERAMCQRLMSGEQTERMLRQSARESLGECYKRLGETAKAEEMLKQVEEMRKEAEDFDAQREPSAVPGPARTARPRVVPNPPAAGRTAEERAADAEGIAAGPAAAPSMPMPAAADAKSPKYWLAQYQSHTRRNEDAAALDDLKQALALAPAEPRPRGKAESPARDQVLVGYARTLGKLGRWEELVEILRGELQSAPANASSAQEAAQLLARADSEDRSGRPAPRPKYPVSAGAERAPTVETMAFASDRPKHHVNAEDSACWTFLTNQTVWDYPHRELLSKMLDNATGASRGPWVDKAVKMTVNTDVSRTKVVAAVMMSIGEFNQAVPLLLDVRQRGNKYMQEEASRQLLQAYYELGDYRTAESLMDAVGPTPEWLGKLAVKAAKAGAWDDALRLWQRKANLDLADKSGVDELARIVEMKHRLRQFYTNVRSSDPASWVPGWALERLK